MEIHFSSPNMANIYKDMCAYMCVGKYHLMGGICKLRGDCCSFFDIYIIADDTKWHILQANAIHDPTSQNELHEYTFPMAYNL
jgi:hypothetical protein